MPWQTDPTTGKKIYVTEDGNQSFSLDGELLRDEREFMPPAKQLPLDNSSSRREAAPIPTQQEGSQSRTDTQSRIAGMNQSGIESLRDLLKPLTDPETINRLETARTGREQELARTYGDLARKRDIEMQNIRSWQAIQQAQINKEAILFSTLANTAYLANTPNASVIQALQVPMQTAARAFQK
jgi:hypothetical protein|tara:strand:+ start:139 stop:687 length:549 start_codon:yes stop_codon:yes gene_type:complete